MKPALLLLLVGALLCCAIQETSQLGGGGGSRLVSLSDSVSELRLTDLEGKWYEIAASKIIHKTFQKDCACIITNFALSKQQPNLLHLTSECRNRATNKIINVEANLNQLMAERYPGAFHIKFIESNAPGPSVVEAQKKVEKKVEKQQTLQSQKGEGELKVDADAKNPLTKEKIKIDESKKDTSQEHLIKKKANFLIVQYDQKAEAMMIAGPTVDAVMIMSRQPNMDNNLYNRWVLFAKEKGFGSLSKSEPCHQL